MFISLTLVWSDFFHLLSNVVKIHSNLAVILTNEGLIRYFFVNIYQQYHIYLDKVKVFRKMILNSFIWEIGDMYMWRNKSYKVIAII